MEKILINACIVLGVLVLIVIIVPFCVKSPPPTDESILDDLDRLLEDLEELPSNNDSEVVNLKSKISNLRKNLTAENREEALELIRQGYDYLNSGK